MSQRESSARERTKSTAIRFHEGLFQGVEDSIPGPDFATELVNWIPEGTGGLRVRGKWFKGSTTGAPTTPKVKGIGLFQRRTDPVVVQMTEWATGSFDTGNTSVVLTWPTPTTRGNALVLVVTVGDRTVSVTFTPPSGYVTTANSVDAAGSTSTTYIAVYEDAESQIGDFVFNLDEAASTFPYSAVAFEVTNVSQLGTISVATSARGDAVTSLATGAFSPSQDSEFLIVAAGAQDIATDNALGTSTSGWSKLTSVDSVGSATSVAGAVFTRTLTAVASQNMTVTSSSAADMSLAIVSLRGWYSPGAIRQRSTPFTGAGTAVTMTPAWDTPTLAGSTLVLMVTATNDTTASLTPAITATGWTSTTAANNATTRTCFAQGFYIANAAAQSGVQSFDFAVATSMNVTAWLVELVGAPTFDDDGQATTASATSLGVAATLTQAWGIGIAAIAHGSGSTDTVSATAPLVELHETNPGNGAHGLGTRTFGATGATTVTWTWADAATQAAATLLTFKATRTAYQAQVSDFLVAHDNTTSYDIYSIDQDDYLAGAGTWVLIDSVPSTDTALPVAFTLGLGGAWYTSETFTHLRLYDGNYPSYVEGSPMGARCVAIHKDRLWGGGTPSLPRRVFYSQAADGRTWAGIGTGYHDIGSDDGEPLEDMTPFIGGLVIGKRTSLSFLVGDTPDQFVPQGLNAGSTAPGRSILATPYGCVIAGREQVWLFDGGSVQPIGKAIERSYGLTGDFVSLSYIDGTIYIADYGTQRIFCFELNSGTWRQEQIGSGNRLSVNQASIETDTTGWAALANCSIARSTAAASDGSASLRLTSTAGGNMSAQTSTGTSGIPVNAFADYAFLCKFISAVSARNVSIDVYWYDSTGTLLSTVTGSAVSGENTSTWFAHAVHATAPAGACYVAMSAVVASTGAGSEVHYADDISIHEGTHEVWGLPNEAASILYNYGETQLYGPAAGTASSLANYRTFPDPVRGKDFDELPEHFSAATPSLWFVGPRSRVTPRGVYVKLRQRAGDENEPGVEMTGTYDDGETTIAETFNPVATPRVYASKKSLGKAAGRSALKLRFAHDLVAGDVATFDIEAVTEEMLIDEEKGTT